MKSNRVSIQFLDSPDISLGSPGKEFDESFVNNPSNRSRRKTTIHPESTTKIEIDVTRKEQMFPLVTNLPPIKRRPLRRHSSSMRVMHESKKISKQTTTDGQSAQRNKNDLREIFRRSVRKYQIAFVFLRELQLTCEKLKNNHKDMMARQNKLFPLYPDDLFCVIFQQVLDLVNIISCIYFPLYIAYFHYQTDVILHQTIENRLFFDSVIYVLQGVYITEIIIRFVSCRINQFNNLVFKWREIIEGYLYGWFFLDLISSVPPNMFFHISPREFSYMDFLHLLKYIKILKFFLSENKTQYISNAEISKRIALPDVETLLQNRFHYSVDLQYLKLTKIFLNMLSLSHIFSCLFFMAARLNGMTNQTWVVTLGIDQNDIVTLYITGFYWALYTVCVIGYGDIPTNTPQEQTLVVVWLFIGVGFYSFTIGNIATILIMSNTSQEVDEELMLLQDLFKSFRFPEPIGDHVSDYMNQNILHNPFWNPQTNRVIMTMPLHLKRYVVVGSTMSVVSAIKFFQLDINFTIDVFSHLQFMRLQPYQAIYRKGQSSSEIYYLLRGEIRLTDNNLNTVLVVAEGGIFGELESIERRERDFNAYAAVPSLILILPTKQFIRGVATNEFLHYELQQLYQRRQILLKESLKKIKLKTFKKTKETLRSGITVNFDGKYRTKQDDSQFRKAIDGQNQRDHQMKLLKTLIGSKQRRRMRIREKFKRLVFRVKHLLKKRKLFRRQNVMSSNGLLSNEDQRFDNLIANLEEGQSQRPKLGLQMKKKFEQIQKEEEMLMEVLKNNQKSAIDRLRVGMMGRALIRMNQNIFTKQLTVYRPRWAERLYTEIAIERQKISEIDHMRKRIQSEFKNFDTLHNLKGLMRNFSKLDYYWLNHQDMMFQLKLQIKEFEDSLSLLSFQIQRLVAQRNEDYPNV